MSVAIFLSYMDYCRDNNIPPDPKDLRAWKQKYNYR